MSERQQEGIDGPRGLYEKLKGGDDRWELWAKLGVAALALQIVAYGVAYAGLGTPSVWAHSVVISLIGISTMPLMFWGLLRTIFRPPVWRLSRTIAFGCLLLVGLLGKVSVLAAPVSTADWNSQQDYQLPFDGPWVTLAGGDEVNHNFHATTMALRWAYDFAPVVDGERFRGDGEVLEDHYCYGMTVRSPVAGKVVTAYGADEDQKPGEYEPNQILGNHVVIRVSDGEFLFMGHFRQGSVTVGTGDEVAAGDPLAECGNSGRTHTPHVHMHLQNSPSFPLSEGLPLRFVDYLADGELVDKGMPRGSVDYEAADGQVVEVQRPWPALADEQDQGAVQEEDGQEEDGQEEDGQDEVRSAESP